MIAAVGSILTAVVASRLYGIKLVGDFALVLAPWAVLVKISTIAEHLGFMRVAAVLPERSEELGALFAALLRFSTALTFATSVLTGVVTSLLYSGPIHRPHLIAPAIVLLAGYLCFDNVGWNLDTLLTSTRQNAALFWSRVSQSLSILCMTLLLSWWMPNIWGLTLGTLFGYVFPFVVRVPAALRVLPHRVSHEATVHARKEFRSLLHFSKDFIPNSWMSGISGQSPTLVLGAYSSQVQLGVFSRAFGITGRLQDIVYRMGANLITYLSRALVQGRPAFVALARKTVLLTLLAIGLPVVILIAHARSVLRVFGSDFVSGGTSLRILAIAVLITSVCSALTGVVVVSVHRATVLAWASAGSQLVGVVASFPLVHRWGANGAASAQFAAAVSLLAAHVFALQRSHNITVLHIPVIRAAGALGSVMGLAMVFERFFPFPFNLVGSALVVPVVFAAVCLSLGLLPWTSDQVAAKVRPGRPRTGLVVDSPVSIRSDAA